MKPSNFPGRKERRQLRAAMPKGQKQEPEISTVLRSIRTKKARATRRRGSA